MVFKLPKQIKSIYDCFLALKEIFIVFSDFKEPFSGAYFSISFVLTLFNFQGTLFARRLSGELFNFSTLYESCQELFSNSFRIFILFRASLVLSQSALLEYHSFRPLSTLLRRFFVVFLK